jgi:tRNA pseudouridine55 synthase
MDGVLVVDKPRGLTSHDVVAIARRCLREPQIGHTGTLDPLATGVLALACGRATRLVRFLTASEKAYNAGIRFGLTTDTYDVTGRETSRSGEIPARDAIERAVASLRGEYAQTPPPFSAKKIDGERAYARARRRQEVTLEPVPVRVTRAELIDLDHSVARIELTCSPGFYVRAFAHTLGQLTGTGACLESLQRTRSGQFSLDEAIGIERIQAGEQEWTPAVQPLERLLPEFPSTTLSEEGRRRVSHGQDLLIAHMLERRGGDGSHPWSGWVRLLDADGRLVGVGVASAAADSLHPTVVLI